MERGRLLPEEVLFSFKTLGFSAAEHESLFETALRQALCDTDLVEQTLVLHTISNTQSYVTLFQIQRG